MSNISYIGITNYQNMHLRFGIKEKDRSGHIYCIGKTGVGKSTLLLNLAISDIKHGNGLGIIDPHGDISDHTFLKVPTKLEANICLSLSATFQSGLKDIGNSVTAGLK